MEDTWQGWFHSDMPKWEYRAYNMGLLETMDWNQVGDEGWELVAIYNGRAYFKRRWPSREGFTLYPKTTAKVE